MRNRIFPFFCCALAAVAILVSGCQKSAKRYHLKGQVLSKKNATNEVEVKHEAIPNFMPAMTMTYKVPDSNAVQGVQPGDAIEADVVVPTNGGDTNQDGKTLHLNQLKGKAVLVSFIYTRCPQPTFCPRTSSQFAFIQDELAKNPKDYEKTHLLSITLDPSYDTAPVLKKYGLAYMNNDASGFVHWDFTSTATSDLSKLAQAFGLEYFQQDNQIVHSMNTVLLGPDGNVAKSWEGNEWKTGDALAALQEAAHKALAEENAKHYRLKGSITAVNKDKLEITVKHSAIAGYMAAMTMPYKVRDSKALETLASGDQIHAQLTVAGDDSYLENIVVDKHMQGKN